MKKILIFYTISALIFTLAALYSSKVNKQVIKIPSWESQLSERFATPFKQKSYARAYFRLVTGLPAKIDFRISESISKTYLWILFSNNTLHFYLIFNLLFSFFSKKIKKRIQSLSLFILSSTSDSFSLLRHFLFRTFNQFIFKNKIKLNEMVMFYLGYSLSAAFYFLSKEPDSINSMLFGFLFVGTYLVTKDLSRMHIFCFEMISVLFICIYFNQNFSFIGFIFSVIFIFLFKKAYSLFLTLLLLGFFLGNSIYLEFIIKFLFKMLKSISILTTADATSATTFLLISLLLIIILPSRKYLIIAIFCLFHTNYVFTPTIYYAR